MFTDSYFPSIDGVVVSLTTTSAELKRRDHEVVVFAPTPVGESDMDIPDRVRWLPSRRFGNYSGYRMAIYPSNIVSIVRSEKPDIIHSHGIGFAGIQALFASRNTGIPNILTYHTMFIDAAPHYSPVPIPMDITERLTWIYQRNYLKRPHIVITPTGAIGEELRSNGVKAQRWEVLPTGVDCSRFNPSLSGIEIRKRLGIHDKKMILSLGRVAPEKNLDLLFKAFSILHQRRKDIKLVIAGGGPAIEHYRAIAKEMNIDDDIIFTGFIPDEDVSLYYAACDAFAISSKFETQGIVVLEAMACGKSVAGIDFRAVSELIEHNRNGYLFRDDPGSCADVLEKAIEDGDAVAAEARKTAEKFSLENCTDRLIRLYEELTVRK